MNPIKRDFFCTTLWGQLYDQVDIDTMFDVLHSPYANTDDLLRGIDLGIRNELE
jgi:hypothetical protein